MRLRWLVTGALVTILVVAAGVVGPPRGAVAPEPAQGSARDGVIEPRAQTRPTESTETPSYGLQPTGRFAPDRVLVSLDRDAVPKELAPTTRELGAELEGRLDGTRIREFELPAGVSVGEAIDAYEDNPAVGFAEPDYAVTPTGRPVVPNDPGFRDLFGLDNDGQTGGVRDADIDAPEAWAVTVGGDEPVVAVIDSGVDIDHPDLRDNIWVNRGEIPGNKVDDDRNGYVDDVHGWDFASDDPSVYDGPEDEHGTHVAGTIAAVAGNGIGVAGVSWRSRIMVLKFLSPRGGYVSDAIRAIDYAVDNGARISNNSWGGAGSSKSLQAAIARAGAAGHLFVAAAGNGGSDGIGDDNDRTPQYPSSYDVPELVSVAATDDSDELARFSNYGASGVDLAAPGVRILSTLPGNAYGYMSGTSMATPHVAGAAALLWSREPELDALTVKERLLASVDPTGLEGLVASGGRLNVGTAVGATEAPPTVSLSVTPATVTPGTTGRAEVQVQRGTDPVAGAEVVVEQRPLGAPDWSEVGSVITGDDGVATLTGLRPGRHVDYRAHLATADATSLAQRVHVRAVLSLRTRVSDLRVGRGRVVSGRLVPQHDGTVRLLVFRNGVRVARVQVPLDGSRFRHVFRPRRPGSYALLATWPADQDHFGARSVRKSFRVRR